MIIPKVHILQLWEKKLIQHLHLQVDLSPDDIKTFDERYLKPFDETFVEGIKKDKAGSVKIVFDLGLKMILMKEFPEYRPVYSDRVGMLKMTVEQFQQANSLSKGEKLVFKERYMKCLDSFQAKNSKKSVIRFNQPLIPKDLEYLKNQYNDDYMVHYTPSETGILLVYDSNGYKANPEQTRLQFQVRKVFQDIRYKKVVPVEVVKAFSQYFAEGSENSAKLVILCGKTEANEKLNVTIKAFDPFCKMMWLTVDDLNKTSDEIFDSILPKLGSDYSYESLVYDLNDLTKDILPQDKVKEFRDKINRFGNQVSLELYVSIVNELYEASKKFIVQTHFNHLQNVLDSLKLTKDLLFQKVFQVSYESKSY